MLAAILSELQNVVPYDTASVQELQGEHMVIIGGRGIDLDHFLGVGFEAVRGNVPNREVLQTGSPVIVGDILGRHPYTDFPSVAHAQSGVRSWLGVPLLYGSKCIGMLALDKLEPGFYAAPHAQAALAFGAQAAIAIKNARLYEGSLRELGERRRAEEELRDANERLNGQLSEIEALQARLRDQAIRDPLTGLFNRRYLTETLQRELARCAREGRPLTVVMLDVDHFKALNDAYGHETGDRMLQELGRFLGDADPPRRRRLPLRRRGVRRSCCRAPPRGGRRARRGVAVGFRAPRRRASGDRRERHALDGRRRSARPTRRSADELLRAADIALYEAKRQGRNRVVAGGAARSVGSKRMAESSAAAVSARAASWASTGPSA